MVIPMFAHRSMMNVASWEREAFMSNHNVNRSSEDEHEDDGEAAHRLARLDDPASLHPYMYASNQPPLVEFSTPHSIATIPTPPTATSSAASRRNNFASLKKSSDSDLEEERKPAAREDNREDSRNLASRREHSFSYDPLPFDDDDAQDQSYVGAGYNDGFLEDFALQHHMSGMGYASHQPPSYAPPPHASAHPHHYQPHPQPINYFFGDHPPDQPQRELHAPTHVPPVARLPHAEPHSQLPQDPEPRRRIISTLSQNDRRPSQEELAEAPTPRARRAIETWYQRFNELIEYKEANGNCNVPQKYEQNTQLGIWVNKQRMEKKFFDEGHDIKKTSMTAKRARLLESIGFAWAKRKGEHSWKEKYDELRRFKEWNGNCDVPTKYTPNPALGRWVSTQRSEYKKFLKGRSKLMTRGKVALLNSIGFKWEMIPSRSSSDED